MDKYVLEVLLMSLFDEEQIMRTYAKDIEKEAVRKTERKTAEQMIRKGRTGDL